MTKNQQQMMLKRVLPIFLASFCLYACGNKLPLVTLVQLDTIHNQANPFKITKYDDVSCKLELQGEDSYPINQSDKLMGAVCLTKEDYASLKASVKSQCEQKKNK